MPRIEDARYERKLLVDMRASPAWKMYEECLRLRIQLRMNDMIQPPLEDQAPNLKEFISGELNGLVQAKDTLIERAIESLNEEIEQLGDTPNPKETEDAAGNRTDSDAYSYPHASASDDPLSFGIATER